MAKDLPGNLSINVEAVPMSFEGAMVADGNVIAKIDVVGAVLSNAALMKAGKHMAKVVSGDKLTGEGAVTEPIKAVVILNKFG